MRQATSEASISVIVVTAVAMLTAVFFTIIWPNLKANMQKSSSCSNAVCDVGFINTPGADHHGQTYCYDPYDDSREIFYCPYRG